MSEQLAPKKLVKKKKRKPKSYQDVEVQTEDHSEDTISCSSALTQPSPTADPNLSLFTKKIIKLTKKNRCLTSEKESYKFKLESLEQTLNKLQNDYLNRGDFEEPPPPPTPNPSEIDSLRKSLLLTKAKLRRAVNQKMMLRKQLNIAQKCIQREIGTKVNVMELASSSKVTWIGRDEQIKVLKEKLFISRIQSGEMEVREAETKFERARSVEYQRMRQENERINWLLSGKTQKINSLEARNKSLSNQIRVLRFENHNLKDKIAEGEDEINNLLSQIMTLKVEIDSKTKEFQRKFSQIQCDELTRDSDMKKFQLKLENSERNFNWSQIECVKLEKILKKTEKELQEVAGDFLFSCRDLKKNQFLAILNTLEGEKDALLKRLEDQETRLSSERDKMDRQHDTILTQKQKISQLEMHLRDSKQVLEQQKAKNWKRQRSLEYSRSVSTIHNPSLASRTQISENEAVPTNASNLELDELNYKLEYANERIAYLQNRIDTLAIEKDAAYREFSSAVRNTKQFIVHCIGEAKEKSTN